MLYGVVRALRYRGVDKTSTWRGQKFIIRQIRRSGEPIFPLKTNLLPRRRWRPPHRDLSFVGVGLEGDNGTQVDSQSPASPINPEHPRI